MWPGPATNVLLLLVVLTCLTAGRGLESAPANGTTEAPVEEEETSPEPGVREAFEDEIDRETSRAPQASDGSSRGVGGIQKGQFVPPWIFVLWMAPQRTHLQAKGDGLLTGLGIRITSRFAIMEIESHLRADDVRGSYKHKFLRSYSGTFPSFIQFRPSQTIDVSKGMGNMGPVAFHWDFIQSLGGNMGLFFLNSFADVKDPNGFEKYELNQGDLPKLQSDKTAKDACYLYTYSYPKSASPAKGRTVNERQWSKWPVKLKACDSDDNLCTFTWDEKGEANTQEGEICASWSDVGAPITCGDYLPKLSYVVAKQKFRNEADELVCNKEYKAVRLADNYAALTNLKWPPGAVGKTDANWMSSMRRVLDTVMKFSPCGKTIMGGVAAAN